MAISRRNFTANAAVMLAGAHAPAVWAQQSTHVQNLQMALRAAQLKNPVRLLLAKQMATHSLNLTRAGERELQGHATSLGVAIDTYEGKELRDLIFRNPLATKLGLAQEVAKGVASGILVPSKYGFVELYRPELPSTLDQAVREFGKHQGQRIKDTLAATASTLIPGGWDQLTTDRVLTQVQGDLKPQLEILLTAMSSNALTEKLGELPTLLLQLSSKQALDARVLSGKFNPKNIVGDGSVSLSFPYTAELNTIKAGVAVADAALGLLGSSTASTRQTLTQTVQAAQSAVQMYQAVALLASTSGLGMFVAVSGMLSGSGGLTALSSVFGGGDDGSAKVLGAIKELRNQIRDGFKNVNNKLDKVLTQLELTLSRIDELKGSINRALNLLEQQNNRFGSLYMQTSRVALLAIADQRDGDLRTCERKLEGRELFSVADVNICRDHLANYALSLRKGAFQLDGVPPNDALQNTFGVAVVSKGGVDVDRYWNAGRAVQSALAQQGMGVVIGGTPAYESTLRDVLNLMVQFKRQLPQLHPHPNDARTRDVRDVLEKHIAFKESLRFSGVLKAITKRYQELIAAMKTKIAIKFDAAVKEQVNADVGQEGVGSVKLTNAQGNSSADYEVLHPHDFKKEGPVNPFVMSRPAGTGNPFYFGSLLRVDVVAFRYQNVVSLPAPSFSQSSSSQVFIGVQADIVVRYDGIALNQAITVTLPSPYYLPRENFAILSDTELARMKTDHVFAMARLGPTESLSDTVIWILQQKQALDLIGKWKRDLIYLNTGSKAYRDAWHQLEKGDLASVKVEETLPELTHIEELGDLIRGCVMLSYPAAAEQSNAMQQLLYGSVAHRLPDRAVLAESLKQIHSARTPPLPWEVFEDRIQKLPQVWDEVEKADASLGPAFDFRFAESQFRTTFPA